MNVKVQVYVDVERAMLIRLGPHRAHVQWADVISGTSNHFSVTYTALFPSFGPCFISSEKQKVLRCLDVKYLLRSTNGHHDCYPLHLHGPRCDLRAHIYNRAQDGYVELISSQVLMILCLLDILTAAFSARSAPLIL